MEMLDLMDLFPLSPLRLIQEMDLTILIMAAACITITNICNYLEEEKIDKHGHQEISKLIVV